VRGESAGDVAMEKRGLSRLGDDQPGLHRPQGASTDSIKSKKGGLMGARHDIARQIADDYSMSYSTAYAVMSSVIDGIVRELKAGHSVTLEGLGAFHPRLVPPHKKFSHFTNRDHEIPQTRKVLFHCSDKLRRL
jgi:nucleoid DNA-binding protein